MQNYNVRKKEEIIKSLEKNFDQSEKKIAKM